jgi:hypothetical protein
MIPIELIAFLLILYFAGPTVAIVISLAFVIVIMLQLGDY